MESTSVRTTLNLDDELIKRAMELTGIEERGSVVRHALKTLIGLETSRRLARLKATLPTLQEVPRRRPWEDE